VKGAACVARDEIKPEQQREFAVAQTVLQRKPPESLDRFTVFR
jgi:hypothetical protein